MRHGVAPWVALLALLTAFPAFAQHEVPISGRLTEGGEPVDGRVFLTFNLYDAPAGTTSWIATYGESVTVVQGVFHGRAIFNEADFEGSGQQRWIGVTVNGALEMEPRVYVGSVPYAIRSSHAATSDYADQAIQAESVSPLAMPMMNFREGAAPAATLPTIGWALIDSVDIEVPTHGYTVVRFDGEVKVYPAGDQHVAQYVISENPLPTSCGQ